MKKKNPTLLYFMALFAVMLVLCTCSNKYDEVPPKTGDGKFEYNVPLGTNPSAADRAAQQAARAEYSLATGIPIN